MDRLNLLIVEGNTKEANSGFKKAGCTSQSENFKKHIEMYEPNSKIDITEPCDDASMSKIISSLEKYNGIVLTGSTLRINDENDKEVKKHVEFAKKCFEYGKNFLQLVGVCRLL